MTPVRELEKPGLAGETFEGGLLPPVRVYVGNLPPDNQPQKKMICSIKRLMRRFKEHVSSFGGHAPDAMNRAIAALRAVGPDPAKIRDHIENTRGVVGMRAIFDMSARDHSGFSKRYWQMSVVKDGR